MRVQVRGCRAVPFGRAVLLSFGVGLAGAAVPGGAAAQVAVPRLVESLAPADGVAGRTLEVTNEGLYPIEVAVVVNDWRVDAEGRHHFAAPGSYDGSCGGRLRPGAETLRIGAGATAALRLEYTGTAADRCRAIVFLKVEGDGDMVGGDRLIISTGVKVYVEQDGT
jgi:hypothetical protein